MGKLAKILTQVEKANEARKARALEQGFDVDKVYYHGTGSNFDAFNEGYGGVYFSDSPEYADRYTTRQGESGRNIIPVHLKLENTFDTRNPEHRKIYEEKFLNKWGNGTPLRDDGLPDWVEADDFQEFFEEEGLPFDSAIVGEPPTPMPDGTFRPEKSLLVTKEENIRSKFAEFKPENIGKNTLSGKAKPKPLAGIAATGTAAAAAPIAYNQAQSIDRNQGIDEQRQASYAKQKQFFDNFSARRLARKAAKTAIGTGEAALTIGSGLANESAAGLAGLYAAATGQNPADIIQHFQENPSLYLPQTEEGMAQLEGLQGLIDDTVKYWGPRGGTQAIQNFKQSQDYLNTQGAKIDPSLGAGMATALGLLPEVL